MKLEFCKLVQNVMREEGEREAEEPSPKKPTQNCFGKILLRQRVNIKLQKE